MPWKGSLITASTNSMTLKASLRSVLTQNSRSRRNSASNTASRLGVSFKPHLPPQSLDRTRFAFALFGTAQRCQEPFRIGWRAEQVCGLHQARQFIGRNQRNISCAAAADDDDFAIVGYLVEHRGQALTQAGVCGFDRHWFGSQYKRTEILYGLSNCGGYAARVRRARTSRISAPTKAIHPIVMAKGMATWR